MNNEKTSSRYQQPSLDDRQSAERKLCRLFESFGIDALAQRDRLIDPFVDRAAAFWRPSAGGDLATLAADEAEAELESWFTTVLGRGSDEGDSAIMKGRAAFLMCSGPTHWPAQLLRSPDDLPSDFVAALCDHAPSAVPPSELGEMNHQPYEAWSPASVLTRAMPADRGFFQGVAGRVANLVWRDTRQAS